MERGDENTLCVQGPYNNYEGLACVVESRVLIMGVFKLIFCCCFFVFFGGGRVDRVHRPICTQMVRDIKVYLSRIAMCATVIKYNVSMRTCR